jgi:hypothetical protein
MMQKYHSGSVKETDYWKEGGREGGDKNRSFKGRLGKGILRTN